MAHEDFAEEDQYIAGMEALGRAETEAFVASLMTDQALPLTMDHESAIAAGLHFPSGFVVSQRGDYLNGVNGSSHSSIVSGMLRSGHDIVSIEGVQDRVE